MSNPNNFADDTRFLQTPSPIEHIVPVYGGHPHASGFEQATRPFICEVDPELRTVFRHLHIVLHHVDIGQPVCLEVFHQQLFDPLIRRLRRTRRTVLSESTSQLVRLADILLLWTRPKQPEPIKSGDLAGCRKV